MKRPLSFKRAREGETCISLSLLFSLVSYFMCASAQSLTREPFFLPKTRAHILIKNYFWCAFFFKSFPHSRAQNSCWWTLRPRGAARAK